MDMTSVESRPCAATARHNIVKSNLVYDVRVPLATHYVYDVYGVLPVPIKVNDTKSKYTFIQPENEYILIDSTKQYYVKFRQEDVRKCRKMNKQIICEQNFPLLISHSASDVKC
jgi:hypothetical protein